MEYAGGSSDGSRVFFETEEPHPDADKNETTDLYEGAGGTGKLVSAGPGGTGLKSGGSFGGTSADGSRVFFEKASRFG